MEEFEKGSLRFNVFDMSGANKYRSLWEKYYKDAEAVVFVVDTADKFRMCVVKVSLGQGNPREERTRSTLFLTQPLLTTPHFVSQDELERLLSHADLQKVPILFFANKKDLINVSRLQHSVLLLSVRIHLS